MTSVPSRTLDFSSELAAVQFDQALDDRQAEARAFFGVLLRQRAAAERGQDDRDFLFGMPGPVSRIDRYWPPVLVQPTLIVMLPPCGVNLIALLSRLSVT